MASDNLRWWILLTVIIGTFLGRLDQTIVNLAIPKIMSDFGITFTEAGWIATAYILANAIFVPIWGKLGDTVGRKKVYILGFTIFIIGSVLAGMAWNLTSMIGFRIIQAIAGSADYPTAMAILAVTFKGKERAEALDLLVRIVRRRQRLRAAHRRAADRHLRLDVDFPGEPACRQDWDWRWRSIREGIRVRERRLSNSTGGERSPWASRCPRWCWSSTKE